MDTLHDSTEWKFAGYIYFCSARLPAGENYEEPVQVAEQEQYLPNVPAPVLHMAIFYNSATEPDSLATGIH